MRSHYKNRVCDIEIDEVCDALNNIRHSPSIPNEYTTVLHRAEILMRNLQTERHMLEYDEKQLKVGSATKKLHHIDKKPLSDCKNIKASYGTICTHCGKCKFLSRAALDIQ